MIKLTHENFIKARNYIYANSDDINRSWFRYNFEYDACEIVNSPDSFLYPGAISEFDESLDALVIRMNEEGRWRLKWQLGGSEVFDRLQGMGRWPRPSQKSNGISAIIKTNS